MSYDAVLLLSFGGPEGPADVMPFLRRVTAGRGVGDDRLAQVAEQYELFGGRSPINDQCRDLLAALQAEFSANSLDLPLYWGNRNWAPLLDDTVAEMADDGITDALVFATSAFGSYSGCRQYKENLLAAAKSVGERAPRLSKLRLFYNHPGFIEPMAYNLAASIADRAALGDRGADRGGSDRVVFTAHSIPESMAAGCDYVGQLNDACALVMEAAGLDAQPYDLVFQSRSGPPSVPWLGPDVNEHLEALAAQETSVVYLVPIGFISDHMEVLYDLDTQAAATADRLGLTLDRVSTVGTHPRFVTMIRQLVEERLAVEGTADDGQPAKPRLSLGSQGPWPDECAPDHCPAPRRRSH